MRRDRKLGSVDRGFGVLRGIIYGVVCLSALKFSGFACGERSPLKERKDKSSVLLFCLL